ncbi:MAG: hypothetical protein GF334_07925 [Candidatus Altiarchaeales archaeon]|nr:hypothetical protein [Candidatus Altiarchaeales archaeon]
MMTDLIEALQERISALQDEKEELEDSLSRVEAKLEAYEDLLSEELGEESPAPVRKKKRPGRPKGSRSKKKASGKKKSPAKPAKKAPSYAQADELWEQARSSLPAGVNGTTPEEQERARQRFRPAPRPQVHYGVKAGKPEDVMEDAGKKRSNANISVEDD